MKLSPSLVLLAAALLAGCATPPPAPVAPAPAAVVRPAVATAAPTLAAVVPAVLPSAAAPGFVMPPDVSPAQPVIPARRFKLTDFGAVGDGQTLNTEAFRKAFAAVAAAGGGTLVVPAGTFYTGPIDLCSSLNLRLEAGAVIQFPPMPAGGVKGLGLRPYVLGGNLHDVLISGTGTINGHGEGWWPSARSFKADANARHLRGNTSPRPTLVRFNSCQRVRLEGITLTNAPVFNLNTSLCQDVTVEGITIFNPADSPNTDGIDPSASQRVLISHCRIDTGDDCIAVKAGNPAGGVTRDILVTDCTFLHGHGCSIGSETFTGLRNMVVRRCTFDGTKYGMRLKSDRTRGGEVQDVIYTDLTMRNVGQAIQITCYYPDSATPEFNQQVPPAPVTRTTPHFHDIIIRNVTAVDCTKAAGEILGLPESPTAHITLEHVNLEGPVGLRISCSSGVTLRDVRVQAQSGPTLLVEDSVTGLVQASAAPQKSN